MTTHDHDRLQCYWPVVIALAVATVLVTPFASAVFPTPRWVHWDMGINAYNGYHAVHDLVLHRDLKTSYPGGAELCIGALMRLFGPDLDRVYWPVAVLGGLNVILMAAVARRFMRDTIGLWVALAGALVGPMSCYSGYPAWYPVTFGLVVIWATTAFFTTGNHGWLVPAGLAVGLAIVFKHSVGVFYAAWLGVIFLTVHAWRIRTSSGYRVGLDRMAGLAPPSGRRWVAAGAAALWLVGTAALWVYTLHHHLGRDNVACFLVVPMLVLGAVGVFAVRAYARAGQLRWLGQVVRVGVVASVPGVVLVGYLAWTGAMPDAAHNLLVRAWLFTEALHARYPLSPFRIAVYLAILFALLGIKHLCNQRRLSAGAARCLVLALLAVAAVSQHLAVKLLPGTRLLVRFHQILFFIPIGAMVWGLIVLVGLFRRAALGQSDARDARNLVPIVSVLGIALASHLTLYPISLVPYLGYVMPLSVLLVGHMLDWATRPAPCTRLTDLVAASSAKRTWGVAWLAPVAALVLLVLPRVRLTSDPLTGLARARATSLLDTTVGHVRVLPCVAARTAPVVAYLRSKPDRPVAVISLDAWLLAFLTHRTLPAHDFQADLYRLMIHDTTVTKQVYYRLFQHIDDHHIHTVVTDTARHRLIARLCPDLAERLRTDFTVVHRNLDYTVLERRNALARAR